MTLQGPSHPCNRPDSGSLGTRGSLSCDTVFSIEGVPDQEARETQHHLTQDLAQWKAKALEDASTANTAALAEALNEACRRIETCARAQANSLDLSMLGLPSLPEALGSLNHIESLDVSYNALTRLPLQLDELDHLRELLVNGNLLSAIPEELRFRHGLEFIDLSNNPLNDLPADLPGAIKRGTRVLAHHTQISEERQLSIAQDLGAHFPEDLFQRAWQAMSASARQSSMRRNSSEHWKPADHRPRLGSPF
jgi:hypothetical protein